MKPITLVDRQTIVRDSIQTPEITKGDPSHAGVSKSEVFLVTGCTLTAIVLRVFMLRYAGTLTSDGVWYAILGKNLISGDFEGGLSTYWAPLYPFLIGVTSLSVGDLELAGRLVSVVSGGLLVIPIYLLARRLYGRPEAGVAAFLTTIHPVLTSHSTQVLTESLYTLLFTLSIVVALYALTEKKRWLFFLTGAGFGACYLVKPEAIGFAALIVVLTLSRKLFNRNTSVRSVLVSALLACIGFGVLSFPYLFYLRSETGRWTFSEKLTGAFEDSGVGVRNLIENGQTTRADKLWAAGSSRASRDSRDSSSASREVSEAGSPGYKISSGLRLPPPVLVAQRLYTECKMLVGVVGPILFFIAALGFVSTSWSRKRAVKEGYLLFFMICLLFGYALAGVQKRYLAAVLPIFIVWSSRGVLGLESRLCTVEKELGETRLALSEHRAALRSVLLVCLAASLAPSLFAHSTNDGNEKHTASWIKQDSHPAPPLVMAGGPLVGFLAGGKHLYTPDEEYDVVVDYAGRMAVDYLVVEERLIGVNPRLRFLLDDARGHPGLALVYGDDAPGRKVRVFKLMEPRQAIKR